MKRRVNTTSDFNGVIKFRINELWPLMHYSPIIVLQITWTSFFYTESCTNACLSNNLNELSCLFIRSASVLILMYGSVYIYDKRSYNELNWPNKISCNLKQLRNSLLKMRISDGTVFQMLPQMSISNDACIFHSGGLQKIFLGSSIMFAVTITTLNDMQWQRKWQLPI